MMVNNIYSGTTGGRSEDETLELLAGSENVKIKKIISEGHASPKGFWYDQDVDEWVVLLTGSAGLAFAGSHDVVALKPGDWINIPAHVRHRVEWTDAAEKTIWLAVYYR
ncbi:phosphoribosylaminoimidazole carboxylase [Desulfoferrobacter suflitae]|uniref:phosphoribosylaminoimidazole carboxylase n=1 Tax=Desulfoferrobacter suflitae TaxID=2865782 RepID=UPI0021641854|nr:phosphoribosylaminoimidazole carboxylase [Desulfoferrobacter suflitae]MCK8603143.1 phosphoribosylaminoimidazole carboxylase [Desulfoferrobacter suflitae]